MGSAEKRAIGARLEQIRSSLSLDRPQMAERLGVKLRAYTDYLAGMSAPRADQLGFVVIEGWNANWLLTGEGPERPIAAAETPASYGSHDLSAGQLSIALEMADEKLARHGLWLPKLDYAELVLLILDRLRQGWAYPKVRAHVDAVLTRLAQGESVDDGRSGGLDRESESSPGKGEIGKP